MRLSAFDCVHRGLVNLRANWELVCIQWLQIVIATVLTIVGFLPPLAALGFSTAEAFDSTPSDWPALFSSAYGLVERAREGWVVLLVSLLVSSAIWMIAALVYCYFQGGIFGVLMAADRQAPLGAPKAWRWFRTFSSRDLRGWASRYLWRYFLLLNLFMLISTIWLFLPVLLILLVVWGNDLWGGTAAFGIGCGGVIPIAFSLLVVALWSNLAKAELARGESTVMAATRRSLNLLGRRLGAVLIMFCAVIVISVLIGLGFSMVSSIASLALRNSMALQIGGQAVLSLVELLITGALGLVWSAALIALIRSEAA